MRCRLFFSSLVLKSFSVCGCPQRAIVSPVSIPLFVAVAFVVVVVVLRGELVAIVFFLLQKPGNAHGLYSLLSDASVQVSLVVK